MNTILITNEPDGDLANNLIEREKTRLVCVTQNDVYIRTADSIILGATLTISTQPLIDLPIIRSELSKAYPLIDRWVDNKVSISTALEQMMEYTTRLIGVIEQHGPDFAVLETGAPHHLFTYCLDTALKYLSISAFYLYGNAFDLRCIIFRENDKQEHAIVSDYSADSVVEEYVRHVEENIDYKPQDSINSLSSFLNRQPTYAAYIHLKQKLATYYQKHIKPSRNNNSLSIKLDLPTISFWHFLGLMQKQRAYQRLIKVSIPFDTKTIKSTDVVFAGHMIPEATSFPECPDYPGEIDILLDLKCRFPDAQIFYREHPAISLFSEENHIHFQGLHKNPVFYKQLQSIGIKIISPSTSISEIRKTQCLFATKTGRIAIENSILGLPTLIYGFPFYGAGIPGAVNIRSLSEEKTVQEIKWLVRRNNKSSSSVKEHLTKMFSGSISNPGIGIKTNSQNDLFIEDIIRFVSITLQKK